MGGCQDIQYQFTQHAPPYGWGDPHIITVDNVHYNFQGQGDFVALRLKGLEGKEDWEVQTRQRAIATTFLPPADDYDDVRTCVSLYSAVAARVGKHKVSFEPDPSVDPPPMQLWIDGELIVESDPEAKKKALGAGVKPLVGDSFGNGINVDLPDKTILTVTPGYWKDQHQWYLNVNFTPTAAHEGIFGERARYRCDEATATSQRKENAAPPPLRECLSWLPALPDGTSLKQMPKDPHDRYVALYETFANAWRVPEGTSNAFHHRFGPPIADGWPREIGKSETDPALCAIGDQKPAPEGDARVAEQHCKAVVDPRLRADCVFDVRATGHTGFADTYVKTQEQLPGAIKTTLKGDRESSAPGENVTFTASVEPRVPGSAGGSPPGAVQFLVDGTKVGTPIALDAGGRAQWTTASLTVGAHRIMAEYSPTAGWGGPFLASNIPEKSHLVVAANGWPLWLVLLLLAILIALVIWWLLRSK